MWESDWPERGIAHRSEVKLERRVLAQRAGIVDSKPHDEIVRVLSVHQRVAECCLASLEKLRIAALRDSRRIETEHELEHEGALPQLVAGGEHAPALRVELVGAARTGLLRI